LNFVYIKSEGYGMGAIIRSIDFDLVVKNVNDAVKQGKKYDSVSTDYHSMRDELRRIENGEIHEFTYPGGYKQLKKDVESGMYDEK
jgi:hypothetical protein